MRKLEQTPKCMICEAVRHKMIGTNRFFLNLRDFLMAPPSVELSGNSSQMLVWSPAFSLQRLLWISKWELDGEDGCSSTYPQPSSHVTGRLGLCSQSLRCDCSWSSRRVAVQPKPALSQDICSLESMLRMMRGTGRRWARVTTVRSTGQICCCANHCVMQALQKACSQWGAWESRKTDQEVTWTQYALTFLANWCAFSRPFTV